MKKRIAIAVLVCMILLAFAPVASAITIVPYASTSVDGGLVRVSGNTYTLWASGTGIYEYKLVSATLYIYSGGGWSYVDSVSNSGYTQTVYANKNISIASGYYKVVASSTTSTGTSTMPLYFNV